MSEAMKNLEEKIARDLHNLVYLEEFVFARNKFSPPGSSEIELADAIVALGDTLMILQIKERSLSKEGDGPKERAWFNRRVLKDATRQVRKTLEHLFSNDELSIGNERGRSFNLAARMFQSIVKIVVYRGGEKLPIECRLIKFHASRSAGFIHVIEFDDYVQMSRLLQVPDEILRYLEYREQVITQFPAQCAKISEASLVGAFIAGDVPPKYDSYMHLHRLVDDEETWNIIPLLRGLRDHYSDDKYNDDYYGILTQFMRLPRSMWREVKLRIQKCIEMVSADKFVLPYRVTFPEREVGFVFVPISSEISSSAAWDAQKAQTLLNFIQAHKYDQRLPRCVGVLVSKSAEMFDIQWGMIEQDWVHDPVLARALNENFPFRPVAEKERFGFFTVQ